MSIILAALAIVVAASTTMAAIEFAQQQHTALADPWSWGKSPSKNWLKCYYSGSSDCSDVR
ncbi:MAG: hypothetical protein WBF33_33665 [Candidatus Nitrosopolaris sp.]